MTAGKEEVSIGKRRLVTTGKGGNGSWCSIADERAIVKANPEGVIVNRVMRVEGMGEELMQVVMLKCVEECLLQWKVDIGQLDKSGHSFSW